MTFDAKINISLDDIIRAATELNGQLIYQAIAKIIITNPENFLLSINPAQRKELFDFFGDIATGERMVRKELI
ncbi:MAG: hypothetical protein PHN44_10235 [Candidatus Marinimicrobia bacterium]|nr:hypothetical protein [Candidatus Neomarinimicrobiota bacterium]